MNVKIQSFKQTTVCRNFFETKYAPRYLDTRKSSIPRPAFAAMLSSMCRHAKLSISRIACTSMLTDQSVLFPEVPKFSGFKMYEYTSTLFFFRHFLKENFCDEASHKVGYILKEKNSPKREAKWYYQELSDEFFMQFAHKNNYNMPIEFLRPLILMSI